MSEIAVEGILVINWFHLISRKIKSVVAELQKLQHHASFKFERCWILSIIVEKKSNYTTNNHRSPHEDRKEKQTAEINAKPEVRAL